MYYPKMQTLWKRDPLNNFVIMPGEYSREEFINVQKWKYTEKIDGMNIKVIYKDDSLYYGPQLSFEGRTERATLPKQLVSFLEETFTLPKMGYKFKDVKEVTLYGEGYGAGIQKGGGLYQEAKEFILFDVVINGIWLLRDSVEDIANYFGINYVPEINPYKTITDIVDYLKGHPQSLIAKGDKIMEGIVARSDPLMLFRNGNPLMWKLKTRDFDELEAIKKVEKQKKDK